MNIAGSSFFPGSNGSVSFATVDHPERVLILFWLSFCVSCLVTLCACASSFCTAGASGCDGEDNIVGPLSSSALCVGAGRTDRFVV